MALVHRLKRNTEYKIIPKAKNPGPITIIIKEKSRSIIIDADENDWECVVDDISSDSFSKRETT